MEKKISCHADIWDAVVLKQWYLTCTLNKSGGLEESCRLKNADAEYCFKESWFVNER